METEHNSAVPSLGAGYGFVRDKRHGAEMLCGVFVCGWGQIGGAGGEVWCIYSCVFDGLEKVSFLLRYLQVQ